MIENFDKLDAEQIADLTAFTARDDLLVKGTDATKSVPYRGGCLPYLLFATAGLVAMLGPAVLGLDEPMAFGLAAAMAALGTLRVVRTFRAVQKARKLTAREEPWHALAWSADELCFRSWERCLLAPWSEVTQIAHLQGEDVNPILRDTLWIHLANKEKALIRPRTDDLRFAGRTLADWERDLKKKLEATRAGG
ncbi:MAG: hypothetical protein GY898_12745 [Proteobacteria bacterium]|nr:hypothetical protein [Pseudomonadota bacterium]